jgi:hypothetical protein
LIEFVKRHASAKPHLSDLIAERSSALAAG